MGELSLGKVWVPSPLRRQNSQANRDPRLNSLGKVTPRCLAYLSLGARKSRESAFRAQICKLLICLPHFFPRNTTQQYTATNTLIQSRSCVLIKFTRLFQRFYDAPAYPRKRETGTDSTRARGVTSTEQLWITTIGGTVSRHRLACHSIGKSCSEGGDFASVWL